MNEIKWVRIEPNKTAADEVESLTKKYGIGNIIIMETPKSLMGNYKVLVLSITTKRMTIKLEGPGLIVEKICETLISKGVKTGMNISS
jgi:hypothetical protein